MLLVGVIRSGAGFMTGKLIVMAVLISMFVVATACESADTDRVPVRTSQLSTDRDLDGFNFSVELPEGWIASESFDIGTSTVPSGWIRNGKDDDEDTVLMSWAAVDESRSGYMLRSTEFGHAVEEKVIEGASARFYRPDSLVPTASVFQIVAAVFDRVPGAPDDMQAPLTLQNRAFVEEDIPVLLEIMESVRYAERPSLTPSPLAPAVPGEDWVRFTPADFDGVRQGLSPKFSILLPPGSSAVVSPGFDTVLFGFQTDHLSVNGERGHPDTVIGLPASEPGTVLWSETVLGELVHFAQTEQANGRYMLLAHFPRLPGEAGNSASRSDSNAATLIARDVPGEHRADLLAIFLSVMRDDESG